MSDFTLDFCAILLVIALFILFWSFITQNSTKLNSNIAVYIIGIVALIIIFFR